MENRAVGRRFPFALLAILLAFVVLAGAVSVVNPLFESTDEIRHYRYVRHLVVYRQLPVQGAEAARSQSHHPPLYYALSALASGWIPSPHTPEIEQPLNPFWGYRMWEVSVDNKLQYRHDPAEEFPFRAGYLAAVVPRWVNVLLGAVAVYLTYRLGRQVWPDRLPLAWGAAALVAFTPQFLYLSGAMNNDVIAAAAGAAVLLVSVRIVQQGAGQKQLVALGLAYGLALLSKFHLLAMGGVIGLALALAAWRAPPFERPEPGARSRPLARWLRGLNVVLGLAVIVAGWWFLRNWRLYGDPTGMSKVNELWIGRPASEGWWALSQSLPYLWSSLWGRFGYGQIPLPQAIYGGLLFCCALALVGYLLPRRGPLPRAALLLLAVTVAGYVAVVFYYILIQPAGPMGRFLFPAFPAFAVLVVGGLDRWLRRPGWSAGIAAVGMAALALVALLGYLFPAVSAPPSLPAPPDDDGVLQFGDVAQLRAFEISSGSLRPGEPLYVTLVWSPLRRTAQPYVVYVHLIDDAGVLIAQRDTWPGLGRAPTTAWQPGQPFVDTYRVDLPETAYAPNRATVRVGLYEPALGRLPVTIAGEPAGDGMVVGMVTVEAPPGPWPNPLAANFGDEIQLVGYTVEPRALSAGGTFTLTLYWEPLRQPQHDYLVFAQVIDSEWNVWGSRDGRSPGWTEGQVVGDVRLITLRPDTPAGSYPIQIGLFHDETGRLPLLAADGHHLDERVLLGPIRVEEP
ncbi:MAG: glycosyltransferase family 39 protein [Anaerolineae bacterium]|nr:glycosyltransferase family 39 protein [Anaerolineae bacterium]